MFLSERRDSWRDSQSLGEVETISLGGAAPTIVSAGAQYGVRSFGPGGMCWVPKRGQAVLVIKAGETGAESCVAGAEMENTDGLEPGELRLFAGDGSLELKNDGSIRITGTVIVNGKEIG